MSPKNVLQKFLPVSPRTVSFFCILLKMHSTCILPSKCWKLEEAILCYATLSQPHRDWDVHLVSLWGQSWLFAADGWLHTRRWKLADTPAHPSPRSLPETHAESDSAPVISALNEQGRELIVGLGFHPSFSEALTCMKMPKLEKPLQSGNKHLSNMKQAIWSRSGLFTLFTLPHQLVYVQGPARPLTWDNLHLMKFNLSFVGSNRVHLLNSKPGIRNRDSSNRYEVTLYLSSSSR